MIDEKHGTTVTRTRSPTSRKRETGDGEKPETAETATAANRRPLASIDGESQHLYLRIVTTLDDPDSFVHAPVINHQDF